MFKRLLNFLLLANGITPAGHKENDKFAKIRAERERYEHEQAQSSPKERREEHPTTPDRKAG